MAELDRQPGSAGQIEAVEDRGALETAQRILSSTGVGATAMGGRATVPVDGMSVASLMAKCLCRNGPNRFQERNEGVLHWPRSRSRNALARTMLVPLKNPRRNRSSSPETM